MHRAFDSPELGKSVGVGVEYSGPELISVSTST